MAESDVLIVGAGVVGLAVAYACLKQGKRVAILERHTKPVGASVRNFGMIWPVGQVRGEMLDIAMRSTAIWQELSSEAKFFCEQSGSMHLAYQDDEYNVLCEYVESEGQHRPVGMLDGNEVQKRAPGVNPQGLVGGMYSDSELNVESRTAIEKIWLYLESEGIEIIRGCEAADVSGGRVITTDKRCYESSDIYLTAGHDGVRHYPECFPSDSFVACKLQMMRTVPQPQGWKMGTHIAGGWTLRHYRSFEHCPSLPALKERISAEQPEFDKYGIHIMLSQHSDGELVIGDSHVYGESIDPFDDGEIDSLILQHAKKLVVAPTWKIDKRWHGVYLKRTDGQPLLVEQPEEGVTILNAFGGAGMTLSMGAAERVVTGQISNTSAYKAPVKQSV